MEATTAKEAAMTNLTLSDLDMVAVNKFVELLQERTDKHEQEKGYQFGHTFSVQVNQVYIRIVKADKNTGNCPSVYCFLDKQGNILKAAGWKTPTKSSPIRGNIFNENPLQGTGLYGVVSLR